MLTRIPAILRFLSALLLRAKIFLLIATASGFPLRRSSKVNLLFMRSLWALSSFALRLPGFCAWAAWEPAKCTINRAENSVFMGTGRLPHKPDKLPDIADLGLGTAV